MLLFPSAEWVEEYVRRINRSPEYRAAAATWEGDVSYVFEAEPDRGVPRDVWVWLDLWHGSCRGARYGLPPEEGQRARFVIRAPYSRWKEVLRKELDPIRGMMQGRIRVTGDLGQIVRHVRAAGELVNLAAGMPTRFVDEPGEEDGRR